MSDVDNLLTQPVKCVMQADMNTMSGIQNVVDVVKVMKQKAIDCVVVVLENNKFRIVTKTDLIIKVLCEGKDPKETLLKEIMSSNPVTIPQNAPLEKALKIMRDKNLRKLIVVDENNKPVGILDQDRFFRSFVNVAVRMPQAEPKTLMERYIRDIVDHNIYGCR
jgi:CBS domain-containing protein